MTRVKRIRLGWEWDHYMSRGDRAKLLDAADCFFREEFADLSLRDIGTLIDYYSGVCWLWLPVWMRGMLYEKVIEILEYNKRQEVVG